MNTNEMLQSLASQLSSDGRVSHVFGEPVRSGERIVLPVAKVSYAFAGGGGEATQQAHSGAGGAGCVRAVPAGVVEILPGSTRYISFSQPRTWTALLIAGAVIGFIFGSKRLRSRQEP